VSHWSAIYHWLCSDGIFLGVANERIKKIALALALATPLLIPSSFSRCTSDSPAPARNWCRSVPTVGVACHFQHPPRRSKTKHTLKSRSVPFLLQSRLDEECAQLLVDIRRIGVNGEPHTTFGELFDDDAVSNYYEALVGTLKAAKKRKMITFQGQLLLKGVSDKVKITIVE